MIEALVVAGMTVAIYALQVLIALSPPDKRLRTRIIGTAIYLIACLAVFFWLLKTDRYLVSSILTILILAVLYLTTPFVSQSETEKLKGWKAFTPRLSTKWSISEMGWNHRPGEIVLTASAICCALVTFLAIPLDSGDSTFTSILVPAICVALGLCAVAGFWAVVVLVKVAPPHRFSAWVALFLAILSLGVGYFVLAY